MKKSSHIFCARKAPNCLKPFVSNRVAEIQDITASHTWRHVPTKQNPADHLTRGISPSQIGNNDLWWHGPQWLSQPPACWPISSERIEDPPEMRKTIQSFVATKSTELFPFQRFSNLLRLKRAVAYMYRFRNNCRTKANRLHSPISISEMDHAFLTIIKMVQRESFYQELDCLHKNKPFSKSSKLLGLNPFIDADGVIRVGGRLSNSEFSFDKKHPIVLPAKHRVTILIFSWEHINLLHAGPQMLLAAIRERFWPITGRCLSKQTVRKCVTCFRHNPKIVQPVMGDLPKERLQAEPPFNITGVDYAGPFMIKDRKGRGCRISKCYVSLFICFSIKAIHLELVTDLTKDCFILALRRFAAYRGKPSKIFSDNGTNFVSANSELKELGQFLIANEKDIINSCIREHIEWKFIPPHSQHFGGLWEAGVKSFKHHLKSVVGVSYFTFEEFYTLLVQIEAILNSRPLSPLSSNPSDMTPLTPAHFLIGRPLTSVPDTNLMHMSENRLSKYQHIQLLQQHFWERWNKEYISELQLRQKWKETKSELSEGTLVLIKEDNLPPLRWKLGRVEVLHPGRDGVSRVASIRTQSRVIKRTFAKLCPLPTDIIEG